MSRDQGTLTTRVVQTAQRVLFLLAAPKTAVVLLLALAGVLAWGTYVESRHGSAQARWFVYESAWLFGFLTLLGVHVLCAAASRWPWQPRYRGVVVTHLGLLVLLAGAIQSYWGGIEGRISLVENDTIDHLVLTHGDQLSAFWVGRPQEASFEFTFEGGPVDWPAGKCLDLGKVDGVSARVLAYHPRAIATETWVADESRRGGPAVQFTASGPTGMSVVDGWLVDQQFGDAVSVGPIRLQLQQAVSERMVEEFHKPPADDLGEQGQLTMYYADVAERVAVDCSVGQKIPLGTSGIEVEIMEYLPNAVPDRLGNFATKGQQPKNPMLELRVRLPDEDQPLRQIAFAKDPLLNLDGVYSRLCPVKFRYEHAAVQPQHAIELLQTGSGKLLGRLCSAGKRESPRELHAGDEFDLPGQFRLRIARHIPHARRRVSYEAGSASSNHKDSDQSQPAALVEITAGGKSEQIWLRREDPTYGQSTLTMPGGVLALSYAASRVPLGFAMRLVEARGDARPGSADIEGNSSIIRLIDPHRHLDEQHVIAVNHPLTHSGFTIYQTDSGKAARGQVSDFLVTRDPGRILKYAGSFAICAGLAFMFVSRAYIRSCRKVAVRPTALSLEDSAKSDERQQRRLRRAA